MPGGDEVSKFVVLKLLGKDSCRCITACRENRGTVSAVFRSCFTHVTVQSAIVRVHSFQRMTVSNILTGIPLQIVSSI